MEGEGYRRGLFQVNSMTPFAASNWPFSVLLVLPVVGVLPFMAVKFARNSRQRVTYILFGTLGAIMGMAAYMDHADRHFEGYTPVAVAVAITIGAALGVAVSAAIRRGVALLPSKPRWWRIDIAEISPRDLAILFLIGILQYWGIGLLCVQAEICFTDSRFLVAFAFVSYFTHWSSVGGLIGFAVSRNRRRGSLIGAGIGLALSAALMS